MKIKLLNLNIWNYNNWETRKPKIISFIQKHNPDIVVLQEVRDDVRFNKKGDNQAKQLNIKLEYPYYTFYGVSDKRKERPEQYNKYCREGISILSRFPLDKIEKRKLTKHKKDKYSCGNLCVKIKTKPLIELIAVHFSNSDYFSLLHLLETLRYIKSKNINPIIVGDFNIIDSYVLTDLTKDEYLNSFNFKKYISYPLKKETLDYILIPKKFKFKSFQCIGENLSDHKSLIAEIELK